MRQLSKLLFALLISLATITTAFALEPTYGKKSTSIKAVGPNGKYSEVYLVNHTHYRYMVYSTYKDTGRSFNMPLNPYGHYQDAIIYPISYPEYAVCLDVIHDATGRRIYNGCISTGTLYIEYSAANKEEATVVVKP